MKNKQIIMSKEDSELEKALIEEEGQCFGEYSGRAKACKECFIVDECKLETKRLKSQ